MAKYFSQHQRPRFFDRQQLQAADLTLSQDYVIQRQRQLNQHLQGWGVVCGALPSQRARMRVDITEGFALSPAGEHIHIPTISNLDLTDMVDALCPTSPNKCENEIRDLTLVEYEEKKYEKEREKEYYLEKGDDEQSPKSSLKVLYLIARRAEKFTQPVPSMPEACKHPGNTMESSRICDGVEIGLTDTLSPLHTEKNVPCEAIQAILDNRNEVILKRVLSEFFACPAPITEQSNYVVLCTLAIVSRPIANKPNAGNVRQIARIKYASRKQILSNQVLQDSLLCMCKASLPPPKETEPEVKPIDYYEGELDIRYYDTMHGSGSSIDSIVVVNASEAASLKARGYNSMLALAVAETEEIAKGAAISKERAILLRDEALASMRRAEPITIPIDTFDIAKGLQIPTNEIEEVGPVRQKRLRKARLNSVAHVANATVETLEQVLDVAKDRALRIKDNAQSMMMRP